MAAELKGQMVARGKYLSLEEARTSGKIPYKATDEQPSHPATTPPPLSRRARRAAGKRGLETHVLPTPPNASEKARQLIGRLLRLLTKHAPDKAFQLPASLAAEQRALALMTVAAYELSSMPPFIAAPGNNHTDEVG